MSVVAPERVDACVGCGKACGLDDLPFAQCLECATRERRDRAERRAQAKADELARIKAEHSEPHCVVCGREVAEDDLGLCDICNAKLDDVLAGCIVCGKRKEDPDPRRLRCMECEAKLDVPSARTLLEKYLQKVKPGHKKQGRNATGFALFCQLRDARLSKADAERYVREYQRRVPAGDHPYTLTEAFASLDQAYSRAPRAPAYSLSSGSTGLGLDYPLSYATPGVTKKSEVMGEPQMRALLRLHAEGKAHRVPVEAPPIPKRLGRIPRAINEAMLLRFELRLGVGDDRPMPYSASEAVQDLAARGIQTDKRNASRGIRRLEERGRMWSPRPLAPRGDQKDGTKTYLPGARPAVPELACRVEAAAGGPIWAVGVQEPAVEVADDVGVFDAIPARAG